MNSIHRPTKKYLRALTSLIALTLCIVSSVLGQSCFEASAASKLTVSGSATVRSFSCVSKTIHGQAMMQPQTGDSLSVELRVPVQSFNCGKQAMNRDLYEALKADQHPYIQYRVHNADIIASGSTGARRFQIIGALSMAGTTHRDTTIIQGRPAAGQGFRIEGSTPLSLRRFGVTPPTALFGLIQVQDSVRVSVDLLGSNCSLSG